MICIIGAGPVGSYLGYLLGKGGEDVRIYEEHDVIGKPVHCTGIVTSAIKEIVDIDDVIVNKVNKVRIKGKIDEVEIKLRDNFILNREKFDKKLFEMAKDNNVKTFLGKRFKNFENNVVEFNDEKVKGDILVGADGALSKVSKVVFNTEREYMLGLQARVIGEFDTDIFEIYLNYGSFLWVVPESESVARVGVVDKKDVKGILDKFLQMKNMNKAIEWQGGLIPVFNPRFKLQKHNVYLVGDAGGMVKALSHGGIVQGLMGAEELSKSILNNLDYEKLWRKRLGKDLMMSLRLRRILDKFNEDDYEKLINLCKGEKVKGLLEDRDYISRHIWELIFKEPRFLRFLFKGTFF